MPSCFFPPLTYCSSLFEVVFPAVILLWATCRVLKIDLLAEIQIFPLHSTHVARVGVLKTTRVGLYILENTPLSSFCSVEKLFFSSDQNDLCCALLEVDDRGHVHFIHAAYCISVMSISRWVIALLPYPGWGVPRHK